MSPHQNDAVMRRHIAQWKSSGQTQIAYCKAHAIKLHVFSYYKKKLKPDAAPLDSSQLVPVQLVSAFSTALPKSASEPDSFQLSHSNGFSLAINSRTELSTLKPLLELIRSVA